MKFLKCRTFQGGVGGFVVEAMKCARWIVLCGLGLCLACAGAVSPAPTDTAAPDVTVTVVGSSEMVPLLQELSAALQLEHAHIQIHVEGINSAVGLEQVRQGAADLGALTVDPPADLWAAPIALDAIALIVHPDNPLTDVTLAQLGAVFSGRVWQWSDLGVVVPQDEIVVGVREPGSGTRTVFQARVMGDLPLASTAVIMMGSAAMVDYVAAHPGAVGYVSQGWVTAQVRSVSVEGVSPSTSHIADNSYHLVRPFYLVSRQEPTDAARRFVDFCLSDAGQRIVAKKYVAIRLSEP